jgi:Fe-S-cluster containining protein
MWINPFVLFYFQAFCYLCLIETLIPYSETDLTLIARLALEKEEENDRFRNFLLTFDTEFIDKWVFTLNEAISAAIDCTQCGNCCKSLMINISEEEADRLSDHLLQSRKDFDEQYVEKGNHGMMLMNQMPCHFLQDNKCTVYEHRFEGCREFPAMHLPGFQKRLFTTLMHYGRCPIIFNILEQLKEVLLFQR